VVETHEPVFEGSYLELFVPEMRPGTMKWLLVEPFEVESPDLRMVQH
jgi:hypothetical protein